MSNKKNTIKKTTEKILEDFNVINAPVPVEKIATDLGIKISYAPSEQYSGMLIRKENNVALMGINSLESPERIRFTIAHELGHYFLNKKDSVTIDYRNNIHGEGDREKEKRANEFAANLIMPEKFIRDDFEKITSDNIFLDEHLESLASRYKVSKEAMRYRLQNLNLLKFVEVF